MPSPAAFLQSVKLPVLSEVAHRLIQTLDDPDASVSTVRDVIALTRKHHISGLPVVDGKKLVGIVTNRDLRFETKLDQPVKNVMTGKSKLITVSEGTTREQALEILKQRHHTVRLAKQTFKHFQGAIAVVTYVEGEFTWEVHVGDQAEINDFIAPPHGLSIEQSSGPDGVELNFTAAEHLEPAEVWRAFKRPGKPPPTRGVGALRPNPWHRTRRSLWLSCLVFVAAWWLLSARLEADRQPVVAFHQDHIGFAEPLSQEIKIGEPGVPTAIQFSLSAAPLDNAWAYADVLLVNLATQDAVGFGLEASYYHGVDGGESWSEGSSRATATIGGVDGGQYLLQITPQRGGTGPEPLTYEVELVQDVYLQRYVVLSLLVILAFPLLAWLCGWLFERRRWKNSDYSGD